MQIMLIALALLQDPPKDWRAESEVAGLGMSGDRDASRLLEYRDWPESIQLRTFNFETITRDASTSYYRARIEDATQEDQRLAVSMGRYGSHEFTLTWDRIPHRYGFDGRTLYTGVGGGELRISDSIQADVQSSVSTADAVATLQGYLAQGAADLDDEVMLLRDRVSLAFKFFAWDRWTFTAGLESESRSGVRPIGGSFGHLNTVQILAPIDDDAWTFTLAAAMAGDPIDLAFEYAFGLYDNREETVTWDNPYRNTDSTDPLAYAQSFENGPREGLLPLASDTSMHRFSARSGFQFAPTTRLTVDATWTRLLSDAELPPYTTNTAIAATPLPDNDFHGRAVRQSYGVNLSAVPFDALQVQTFARYSNHLDRREEFMQTSYVRTDATLRVATQETEPLDYSKLNAGVSGRWRIPGLNSTLKPAVEYSRRYRRHRETKNVTELGGSLSIETRWTTSISTEIGGGVARQNAGEYEPFAEDHVLMRIYQGVDRDRAHGHAGVTWTPADTLSLGLKYRVSHDDYDLDFGLRDVVVHQALLDLALMSGRPFTVTLFAGFDEFRTEQKGRHSDPMSGFGTSSTPDDPSNWTADTRERVYLAGLRPQWKVSEDVSLAGSYTFAWNRSTIDLDSPLGPGDANAYVPGDLVGAENATRHSVDVRLTTKVAEGARFYVGYGYEVFGSGNFYNSGISSTPTGSVGSSAYLLGLTFEDARVHIGYLGLIMDY